MTTGGSPRSTGVYHDVSWDNALSPAGSNCTTRGALVPYNQTINFNSNTGDSIADINPAKLPRDPDNGCTPVYPHQYLRVNTIYEVAHAAGLRTAVADKHPSYEILSGPSGTGIDDFYGPEFNAAKSDIAKIMVNDELKVVAVLDQIDGLDHRGTASVGVPAIFGMNFQAPNIGQKFSGYVDAAGTTPQDITTLGPLPGTAPGLAQALDYVDDAVGRIVNRLETDGLTDQTMVIVTANHGNSPVDRSTLRWVDPAQFAPLVNMVQTGLTAQVTADTMALIWLKDRGRAADVAAVLQDERLDDRRRHDHERRGGLDALRRAAGREPEPHPRRRRTTRSGGRLRRTQREARRPRQCERRGHARPAGRRRPSVDGALTLNCPVSLRQIAPTILKALGLKEKSLDAVRLEGTQRLPDADPC